MSKSIKWLPKEDEVLKRLYEKVGSKACDEPLRALGLPWTRSLESIQNRAGKLSLIRRKGPVIHQDAPEQTGGPGRYHYQWKPLKTQESLPVRDGSLDFRKLPSL